MHPAGLPPGEQVNLPFVGRFPDEVSLVPGILGFRV